MKIKLSALDTMRFGVVTAKCAPEHLSDLNFVDEWCRHNNVKFVIARISTADVHLAQALENAGFRLMDTLVYFRRDIFTHESTIIELPKGYRIEYDDRPNVDEIEKTAELVFQGYIGHYHADPLLPASKSNAVYSSWAVNSTLSTEVANQIISVYSDVDPVGQKLVAFATLIYSQNQSEGVLFGVHPNHRQRGLHKVLVRAAIASSAQRGCTSIISSTQLNNLQVQKNWAREGFLPSNSFYTFHQWR